MLATFILLSTCAQTPMIPTASAPIVRPLFAGEKWYQDAKSEEKLFEGVLELNPGSGRIGLPARFNSFRLIALEDGKPAIRQIYTSGQNQLLSPVIGHNVKLTAKLVESEADGRKVLELWPASVEVFGLAPAGVIAEWKILARTSNFPVSRQIPAAPQPTVIRTPKHLADYLGPAGAGAASAEDRATTLLNAQLVNTKVDWSKHMIIAISSGSQRAGARVEISRITYGEKGLDVHWKFSSLNPGTNRSVELVLVNKFEGDTTFYQEGITRPTIIPGPGTQAKPDKETEKPDAPATKKTEDVPKKPDDAIKK